MGHFLFLALFLALINLINAQVEAIDVGDTCDDPEDYWFGRRYDVWNKKGCQGRDLDVFTVTHKAIDHTNIFDRSLDSYFYDPGNTTYYYNRLLLSKGADSPFVLWIYGNDSVAYAHIVRNNPVAARTRVAAKVSKDSREATFDPQEVTDGPDDAVPDKVKKMDYDFEEKDGKVRATDPKRRQRRQANGQSSTTESPSTSAHTTAVPTSSVAPPPPPPAPTPAPVGPSGLYKVDKNDPFIFDIPYFLLNKNTFYYYQKNNDTVYSRYVNSSSFTFGAEEVDDQSTFAQEVRKCFKKITQADAEKSVADHVAPRCFVDDKGKVVFSRSGELLDIREDITQYLAQTHRASLYDVFGDKYYCSATDKDNVRGEVVQRYYVDPDCRYVFHHQAKQHLY